MVAPLTKPARDAWARTRLRVWPEDYWIVSLPSAELDWACRLTATAGGAFAALVRDHREITLTLPSEIWAEARHEVRHRDEFGPLAAISFDIPLEMELVGYLAPAALRLAAAGVSIIPQCAFALDHLLVRKDHLETACQALEGLIAEATASWG